MTQQVITAFILGLVGGIVPGPVLAATFAEILQSGFYRSLRIVLLAMIAETVVALLSLIALSSLGLPQSFFFGISFIGAGVLTWIATQLWKVRSLDSDEKVHFSFGKISAMIMANGVLWIYWITVCVPQAITLGNQIKYGEYIFLLLVQTGWLVSTVAVAVGFSMFRSVLSSPRAIPILFRGFALVFLYFALAMVYKSLVYFLS